MYILRKNRRKIRNKVFQSYEEARSFARSLIRRENRADAARWSSGNAPSIREYGFEVERLVH